MIAQYTLILEKINVFNSIDLDLGYNITESEEPILH